MSRAAAASRFLAVQHAMHGQGKLLPAFLLDFQPATSVSGDGVDPRLAIVLGRLHLRAHVAVDFEAMQRGIEGTLAGVQSLLGHLADALRDAPSVIGPEREDSQNQQVECSLEQVALRHNGSSRRLRGAYETDLSKVKRSSGRYPVPRTRGHCTTIILAAELHCSDQRD